MALGVTFISDSPTLNVKRHAREEKHEADREAAETEGEGGDQGEGAIPEDHRRPGHPRDDHRGAHGAAGEDEGHHPHRARDPLQSEGEHI